MTALQLQVGVKVLLRNGEGKYLLVRRSAAAYPEVGARWDIVGGRIEGGQPLMDNLRREVREETGLDLHGEPALVAAQDILRVPGRHVVRLTYAGVIEGVPRLDADHDAWGWFTAEEIRRLDTLDIYVRELIDRHLLLKESP